MVFQHHWWCLLYPSTLYHYLREFVALHYERHPESMRGCRGLSCRRWLRSAGSGGSAGSADCLFFPSLPCVLAHSTSSNFAWKFIFQEAGTKPIILQNRPSFLKNDFQDCSNSSLLPGNEISRPLKIVFVEEGTLKFSVPKPQVLNPKSFLLPQTEFPTSLKIVPASSEMMFKISENCPCFLKNDIRTRPRVLNP